jgi:hypothetical protein
MELESPHNELIRLLQLQRQARQDEAFGGLSTTERDTYERNRERIDELQRYLFEEGAVSPSGAKQKAAWDKKSETDLFHQREARQSYREREKDSERFAERNRDTQEGQESEDEPE